VSRGTTARPPRWKTTVRPSTGKTEVFSGKVFSGKYLPMVNIDNNKVLSGMTARPPGYFNYDKPDKVGYFNYGLGKLLN
jgi:hypothetical protein